MAANNGTQCVQMEAFIYKCSRKQCLKGKGGICDKYL